MGEGLLTEPLRLGRETFGYQKGRDSMIYPGYLREGFEPFDPIELARLTEAKVSRGSSRKYTDFYCVGAYGGISTAYTVGCCLRCIFCEGKPAPQTETDRLRWLLGGGDV